MRLYIGPSRPFEKPRPSMMHLDRSGNVIERLFECRRGTCTLTPRAVTIGSFALAA
jgi:hypothetical protein